MSAWLDREFPLIDIADLEPVGLPTVTERVYHYEADNRIVLEVRLQIVGDSWYVTGWQGCNTDLEPLMQEEG